LRRIIKTETTCRGRARVSGTKITVSELVESVNSGMKLEEIAKKYPRITMEDIKLAMSYYADNKDEVDGEDETTL